MFCVRVVAVAVARVSGEQEKRAPKTGGKPVVGGEEERGKEARSR